VGHRMNRHDYVRGIRACDTLGYAGHRSNRHGYARQLETPNEWAWIYGTPNERA